MPYIIMKRDDIAEGLQVLDLKPNTSQRNLVYDTPGQTKYLNRFQNETVQTIVGGGGAILMRQDTKGLAAYLIDHVEEVKNQLVSIERLIYNQSRELMSHSQMKDDTEG